MDGQVLAAIVAAGGTVFGAVATVVYSQRRSKDRELAEAHRPQKVKVYDAFLTMTVDEMKNAKKGKGVAITSRLIERMFSFKRDLLVWGSPRVIRAYRDFEASPEDEGAKLKIMRVDRILREIRADLGNSNRGLRKGALIQLFLTEELKSVD